jgi:predicted Zn-dependent peptidase
MLKKLNRNIAPLVEMIDNIMFQCPEQQSYHHIETYVFNIGTNAYSLIQFIFPAGKIHSTKKLVADLTADMLLSGTSNKTSYEIAELLDFYGASIESYCNEDETTVRVYCLSRHLELVLDLVKEILFDAVFPEEEATIILSKWKQKQQINFQKTEYVATRLFKNILFGNVHSYGNLVEQEDFDKVSTVDVKEFYQQHYVHAKYKVVTAGCAPDKMNALLQKFTSDNASLRQSQIAPFVAALPNSTKIHSVEMPNVVQSSIVIGREMFNMHHQDYMDFYVLNSLLGGYFGSRLMSNLREDKGYTYGVHSTIYTRLYTGVFEISTEVNKENTKAAIDEIKIELLRLRMELVEEEELQIVKNYIIGHTLRGIDGPIKTSKLFKTLLVHDLNFNFSKEFENSVRKVSPQRLNELANQYLKEDDLYQVVVG